MAGNERSSTLILRFVNQEPTSIVHASTRASQALRNSTPDPPQPKRTPRLWSNRQAPRSCYVRVKSDCLTCRRRKKKCDESKPNCAGCRRNHELCEWPSAGLTPDQVTTTAADGKSSTEPQLSRTNVLTLGHELPAGLDEIEMLVQCRDSKSLLRRGFGLSGPCSYTRSSGLLFRHYLEVTRPMLACVPVQKSPFLNHVVPLAWADDLLTHVVLALSGAHLSCNRAPDDPIRAASWQHYSALLHGLRVSLSGRSIHDVDKSLELLLVLVLLSHYEIISGNSTGNLLHHLFASRELISTLLSHPDLPARLGANNVSLGFCLELYAYILITNSVKPQGIGPGITLQYDPFVMCLSSLDAYTTFGTMFGGLHELLELIPQITLFASERLAEEDADLALPSNNSHAMYGTLKDKIENWQLPETFTDDIRDYQIATSASDVFRSSLRIYLVTAMAGSLVSDAETWSTIQLHVDALLYAVRDVGQSPWATIILWPLTIAGSCMTHSFQRSYLVHQLRTSRYRMAHVLAVCDVLERLWESEDPRAFGPYGLYLMEQKGFCVSIL